MAKEACITDHEMRSLSLQYLKKYLKVEPSYNYSSRSLNKLYKSVSISSKHESDNLFSYLKSEFVRWLENVEISGNMLLRY